MFCVEKARNVKFSAFSDSDILMGMTERGEIFDAYILDIEMQDYSGIEIAEEIRKKFENGVYYFSDFPHEVRSGSLWDGNFPVYDEGGSGQGAAAYPGRSVFPSGMSGKPLFYVIQNQKRCIKFSPPGGGLYL